MLLGVGTAMVYPTLLAAIGDVAHPSWRATAVGIYRLWRDAGFAVGALLAGLVVALRHVRDAPVGGEAMTVARGDGRLRFATFLAPTMLAVYRSLAQRLGRPVELVVGRSFDQFQAGEADLG